MQKATGRISKTFIAFILAVIMVTGSAQVFQAAGEGTMMSNAVNITFGELYLKTWSTLGNHLNHYCKITVPQKGILTVTATKPNDDEGEYGSIYFTLYGDDSEPVWDYHTYNAKSMASDTYRLSIGLNPGTYYMTMKPGFYVTSGVISTYYSFDFTATPYCEVEPNESLANATIINTGNEYTGYYGGDGGDYEDADYWRFSLNAGKTYKIAMGNYSAVESSTAITRLLTPSGDDERTPFDKLVDEDGLNYFLYTPAQDGLYGLRLYNYHKQQYKYTVKVVEQEKKTQTITVPETSIVRNTTESGYFNLNATASTKLSYSSSNTNVATVYSDGDVYTWKAGTAVITITAEESDYYKSASTTVKVTVVDPSAAGKAAATFRKKANPMTVTVKKVTAPFKTLKKKNVAIAAKKAFTVKKAIGKVTFKKVSGSKKITVSKAGKITVKKKLKKGKYPIKVKVTASGNAIYKAKSKTVKLTIIVK